MPFYLTPKQDDYNKIPELQICIAEALYDVDSIVANLGAYTKEELATLHGHIVSNLEQAWEIAGLAAICGWVVIRPSRALRRP